MAYYRHYYLDQNNRISQVEPGEFENDDAAIAFARSTHFGFRTELWNEERRVAVLVRNDMGTVTAHIADREVVVEPAE